MKAKRALIYQKSVVATPEEEAVAESLRKEKFQVGFRNVKRWLGEVEPADVVYTHREDVAAAYKDADVRGFSSLDERLIGTEFDTPEKIRAASDEELLGVKGIGPAALKDIRKTYGAGK